MEKRHKDEFVTRLRVEGEKLEARGRAEEEASDAAGKKEAEEAEWREGLEDEVQLKAENDAREMFGPKHSENLIQHNLKGPD